MQTDAVEAQPGASADAGVGQGMSGPELVRLMGAFNDVTTRLTRTHEALQAEVTKLRGELREAHGQVERSKHLALLGEMAAGIAHEVRNPLGSILLYARMLQQDLGGQPEQRLIADKIAGSVQKLEHVVGDVLAFSREAPCRPLAVGADELVSAALSAARGDGPEWMGVRVVVDVPGDLTLLAEPEQSQRALVNILRNAAEIMHECGTRGRERLIEVGASRASLLGADGKPREMVAICVKDFGPGLPAESAGRLFTPFFTTKRAGTGLGLAIVHRIMDSHGGRVVVRSWQEGDVAGGAVAELLWPAGE